MKKAFLFILLFVPHVIYSQEMTINAAEQYFNTNQFIKGGAIVAYLMKNADGKTKDQALALFNRNISDIDMECTTYTSRVGYFYLRSFINSLDANILNEILVIKPDNIPVLILLATKYLTLNDQQNFYKTLDKLLLNRNTEDADFVRTFDMFKSISFPETKKHIKNIRGDIFYNQVFEISSGIAEKLNKITGNWQYYKDEETDRKGDHFFKLRIDENYQVFIDNNHISYKGKKETDQDITIRLADIVMNSKSLELFVFFDCSWNTHSSMLAYENNGIWSCDGDLKSNSATNSISVHNRGNYMALLFYKKE